MLEKNVITINREVIDLEEFEPNEILLDWIRDKRKLKGTKEGCAEGDCGACSILISPIQGGKFTPANSCLLKLGQIVGSEIITVEGLGNHQNPHPVQKSLSINGGSQCGFCTPGIVVSLVGLLNHEKETYNEEDFHDALAGNLCRCTGYKPILKAFKNVLDVKTSLPHSNKWSATKKFEGKNSCFYLPMSIKEALDISLNNKNTKFIAGGTDLNLDKNYFDNPSYIHLCRIPELSKIELNANEIIIGSACSLEHLLPFLKKSFPYFAEIIKRFGSSQIRSQATLSGNLCTASPIGDAAPCLIALDASLMIATLSGKKFVSVEDFFIDYRKTILEHTDILINIRVPLLNKGNKFYAWKVSKRFDQDISTVSMAANINASNNGIINSCKISFGGLAATPIRSKEIENSMIGTLPLENLNHKINVTSKAFKPISDLRGSSLYRINIAIGLIKRLLQTLNYPNSENEVMNIKEVN